jgi:hypothetical protein
MIVAFLSRIQSRQAATGMGIPKPDFRWVRLGGARSARDQEVTILREDEVPQLEGVAGQRGQGTSGRQVPEPYDAGAVAGGETPAIPRDGDRADFVLVPNVGDDVTARDPPEVVPGKVAGIRLAGFGPGRIEDLLGPLDLFGVECLPRQANPRGIEVPVGQPLPLQGDLLMPLGLLGVPSAEA